VMDPRGSGHVSLDSGYDDSEDDAKEMGLYGFSAVDLDLTDDREEEADDEAERGTEQIEEHNSAVSSARRQKYRQTVVEESGDSPPILGDAARCSPSCSLWLIILIAFVIACTVLIVRIETAPQGLSDGAPQAISQNVPLPAIEIHAPYTQTQPPTGDERAERIEVEFEQ
jgi:hypothetical protein